MDFGSPNFNSRNSLKVEKIMKEAASDGLAESFTESGPQVNLKPTVALHLIFPTAVSFPSLPSHLDPQSVHQIRIMLCTGIFGYTQGISIPISILSLAWGASR